MKLKYLWGTNLAVLFFIAPVSTSQAYVLNIDYELCTYEDDGHLAYLYEESLLRSLHTLYYGK